MNLWLSDFFLFNISLNKELPGAQHDTTATCLTLGASGHTEAYGLTVHYGNNSWFGHKKAQNLKFKIFFGCRPFGLL